MEVKIYMSERAGQIATQESRDIISRIEKDLTKWQGYTPYRNNKPLQTPKAVECREAMKDYSHALTYLWLRKLGLPKSLEAKFEKTPSGRIITITYPDFKETPSTLGKGLEFSKDFLL